MKVNVRGWIWVVIFGAGAAGCQTLDAGSAAGIRSSSTRPVCVQPAAQSRVAKADRASSLRAQSAPAASPPESGGAGDNEGLPGVLLSFDAAMATAEVAVIAEFTDLGAPWCRTGCSVFEKARMRVLLPLRGKIEGERSVELTINVIFPEEGREKGIEIRAERVPKAGTRYLLLLHREASGKVRVIKVFPDTVENRRKVLPVS